MRGPRADAIQEATDHYLSTTQFPPGPLNPDQKKKIKSTLMTQVTTYLESLNANLLQASRYKIPQDLTPYQIVQLILKFDDVANVVMNPADDTQTCIALYMHDGLNEGTYSTRDNDLAALTQSWSTAIDKRGHDEVMRLLKSQAPVRERTANPDLVPVNNGVFDYRTKQLLPFSPDYVFLSKCRVGYNPAAASPVIHNPEDNTDWDVESWMRELSDDPEVVDLLWEVIGASVRPYVPWGKSVWFYSTKGNNGKGTLCSLMRNLIGIRSCAAIPILDFGVAKGRLGALVTATAVICDENDVGEMTSRMSALKAAITNDVFPIENKFQDAFSFKFYGLMVQCFNEYPAIRDRSGSLYRRIRLVPFEKCFTGAERKYIKTDYLTRKDVLEYVLCKVLNTNYYELSEPDACKFLLNDYQVSNNPLQVFVEEMLPLLSWDLVPFNFLYDLYVAWLSRNYPQSRKKNMHDFTRELGEHLESSTEWEFPARIMSQGSNGKYKSAYQQTTADGLMECPEPLILEYDLRKWRNPSFSATYDPDKLCLPPANERSGRKRGIRRRGNSAAAQSTDKTG